MFGEKASVKEADRYEMVFLPSAKYRMQITHRNNFEYSNSGDPLKNPATGRKKLCRQMCRNFLHCHHFVTALDFVLQSKLSSFG